MASGRSVTQKPIFNCSSSSGAVGVPDIVAPAGGRADEGLAMVQFGQFGENVVGAVDMAGSRSSLMCSSRASAKKRIPALSKISHSSSLKPERERWYWESVRGWSPLMHCQYTQSPTSEAEKYPR